MLFLTYLDFPRDWQIGFQDPATAIMEGIIELHNTIFFFLIIITILVFWMFYKIFLYFSYRFNSLFVKNKTEYNNWKFLVFYLIKKNLDSQKINHNSTLEIVWVILPAIVLIFIAIPSFTILYSMDEVFDPILVIKVIGHQWYWSYEYSDIECDIIPFFNGWIFNLPVDFEKQDEEWMKAMDKLIANNKIFRIWESNDYTIRGINFDSLVLSTDSIKTNLKNYIGYCSLRLLETDTTVFLPIKTHIQLLVTSEDVIHSWAVPSLGIKIDCVPGRLNQVSVFIKRSGLFYGQCSEICGINHGFMPIKVAGINKDQYINYIYNKQKLLFFDWNKI